MALQILISRFICLSTYLTNLSDSLQISIEEQSPWLLFFRIKTFGGLGKSLYLCNMKLVFGGVILAGIMNMDVNTTLLFGLGSLFVIILTILGYILTILKHNSRR